MTDNEIIKALECCYGDITENCEICPNRNTCGDIDVIKITVDLINRQKAEIEKLYKTLDHRAEKILQLENDIKGLKKAIKVMEIMTDQHQYDLQKAKAEAIKEFAKWIRVKDRHPDKEGKYIICTDTGTVCTAHYYKNGYRFSAPFDKKAVWWMPFPEPPKGEKP